MARIKKFSHLDNMEGQFGDMIISRNRYGPITYPKPDYIDPKTPGQLRTRNSQTVISELWDSMDPSWIIYWNEIAAMPGIRSKCGSANVTTGRSLFFHLKRNQMEIGEPITTYVGGHYDVQRLRDLSVNFFDDDVQKHLYLDFKPELNEQTKLIIYATHAIKGGVCNPKPSDYKIIGVFDNTFIPGSEITSNYLKIFKEFKPKGISLYFKYKTVTRDTGFASNSDISRLYIDLR